MSGWRSVAKEDIDIDLDRQEIDIFVGNDEFGSNYVSIKISDMLEMLNKARGVA